jgi:membrane-bound lytic murein transglycosylase D
VDERRDPEKATRAAAKYLLDLYKQFGSWYLAAASYNCGEGRVQRELNQSNHKNFWELSANMCLPTETKNYVPQMIAATIIAKNPEKFGFKNVPYLPPVKYDKVPVTETTSLVAASVAVNVPADEVQDLNPELLRGITPPDAQSYTLNLPPSSKEKFLKNITIARIEHPAVASHPIRTARSSGPSYSNGKSSSNHQASVAQKSNNQVSVAHKSKGKSQSSAKASTKAASQTYAKQEKPTKSTPVKAGAAPVVQASLFGTPSLASKSSNTKKTKVALIGTAKNQTKGEAAKSKKTCEPRLANKSDNAPKSAAKPKKASASTSRAKDKDKDKYSRSKSKRDIMVSEAR